MKKTLASLFILGFLAIGTQANASVLSDALLQIQNLKNEIVHLRASLKGSTADIPMPPTLGATTYSNLTPNGVTLTSSVSDLGWTPLLTARGTCYGLSSQGPMLNCLSDGVSALGSYSQNRDGLNPNTSYIAISYATNGTATSYGGSVSFTTPSSGSLPVVSSANSSYITSGTSTLSINITSAGSPATIMDRGTCIGVSPSPLTGCISAGGTAVGTFFHSRSGLTCGTKYFYRGYATNATGTSYSSDNSFYTAGCIVAPTPITFVNIYTSSGTNGTISPTGPISIPANLGQTQQFNITPNNTGYTASGTGCGGSLSGNTYTTAPITGPCTVSATFTAKYVAPTLANIYTSSGTNGTISPTGPVSIPANLGQTQQFTITPNTGYTASGTGCGGSLSGNTYTTAPITGPCTVSATFTAKYVAPTCTNGATNYPTCSYPFDPIPSCYNGATNYPTCTIDTSMPVVGISNYTPSVTTASVVVGAAVTSWKPGINAWGACYGIYPSPTNCIPAYLVQGPSDMFATRFTELTANTTYYYRAYVKTASGTVYSPDGTFKTPASSSPAWSEWANNGGCVNGKQAMTRYCQNPTPNSSVNNEITCSGSISQQMKQIDCAVISAPSIPSVSFLITTNISSNNITVQVPSVKSVNPSTVIEKGMCYGTTLSSTPSKSNGDNCYTFSASQTLFNASNLLPNTTYKFRGYAVNAMGVGYSPEASFTTTASTVINANSIPVLATPTASYVTSGSATLGVTVTSLGYPVSSVAPGYIYYGKTTRPSSPLVSTGYPISIGAYNIPVSGLTCGTKYYFYGTVSNTIGTGYTTDGTFTTLACGTPTISCPLISTPSPTYCTLGLQIKANKDANGCIVSYSCEPKIITSSIDITSPSGAETFVQGGLNKISWIGGKSKVQIGLMSSAVSTGSYVSNSSLAGWIELNGKPNGSITWDGVNLKALDGSIISRVSSGSYKIVAVTQSEDGNYCFQPSSTLASSTSPYMSCAYDISDGYVIVTSITDIKTVTTDLTPRISVWQGKVNQHVDITTKTWKTDSDGVSGAELDKLAYCKKFYPNTTSVVEYKTETINAWHDRGNVNNYPSTKMSYKCVEGSSIAPSVTITSPNGGETYTVGQSITLKWESKNMPSNPRMNIALTYEDGSPAGAGVSDELVGNNKSWVYAIPKNVLPGKYKILVDFKDNSAKDYSDNYFTIKGNNGGACLDSYPSLYTNYYSSIPTEVLLGDKNVEIAKFLLNTSSSCKLNIKSISFVGGGGIAENINLYNEEGALLSKGVLESNSSNSYIFKLNTPIVLNNNESKKLIVRADIKKETDGNTAIQSWIKLNGSEIIDQESGSLLTYNDVKDNSMNPFQKIIAKKNHTPLLKIISPKSGDKLDSSKLISIVFETNNAYPAVHNISLVNKNKNKGSEHSITYLMGADLKHGVSFTDNQIGNSKEQIISFSLQKAIQDWKWDINSNDKYAIRICVLPYRDSCKESDEFNFTTTNSTTPLITVLTPNGGEIYKGGQQITVKWDSKNVVAGVVGIMLVESNNLEKATTIVYPTLNDGIETITLPKVSGKNFKIFISNDQTGGAYSKIFTIAYESDLSNYGKITQSLDTTSQMDMTVSSDKNDVEVVTIALKNTGTTDVLLNGLHLASSSNLNNYINHVKVFDTSTGKQFGQAVNNFGFNGEYYYAWVNSPASVSIPAGTKKVFRVIADIPNGATSGTFAVGNWGLNFDAPGAVMSPQKVNGNKITIKSNSTPSISVLSPSEGDRFKTGDQITVKWNSNGVSPNSQVVMTLENINSGVIIYLTEDKNVPAIFTPNDGIETFKIPTSDYANVKTGDYKITISTLASDGKTSVSDRSDLFTIVASDYTPSLSVLYPKGGETYTAGQQITAKWKTENIPSSETVLIEITRAYKSGDFYGGWTTLSDATPNDGIQTVTLGSNLPAGQYQFVIRRNSLLLDGDGLSDGLFTIVSSSNVGPSITGVSGPQSLALNQTGTWNITASSPNGGNLSYSVDWGEPTSVNSLKSATMPQQTATFTHTYSQPGIYTPVFTVTSENTIRCVTTPCPSNGGSTKTSLSVNVGMSNVYVNNSTVSSNNYGTSGYSTSGAYGTSGYNTSGATYNVLINRTLKWGMIGDDVKRLQEFLGLIPADGKFGKATEDKVKEWQAANNLPSDGKFGYNSRVKAGLNN